MGIFAASALGIASSLCMYGTITIAASFSKGGMKDDWLAAFMMSSILLAAYHLQRGFGEDSAGCAYHFLLFVRKPCRSAVAFMITGAVVNSV